jgi:hypothetical protein
MMARVVAILLGFGFVLVGIAGFFAPALAETRQSVAHNWVHLGSGVISLLFGLCTSRRVASVFDVVFGALWLAVGLAGFVLGRAGDPATDDPRTLRLVPGQLELSSTDHLLHIVLGILYLAGGVLGRKGRSAAGLPLVGRTRPGDVP